MGINHARRVDFLLSIGVGFGGHFAHVGDDPDFIAAEEF